MAADRSSRLLGIEGHCESLWRGSKCRSILCAQDAHNLLRPETMESLFVLWRVTRDPVYREWGWLMFRAWQKFARVATGGYASLNSVLEVRCTPDKHSYTASNLLPSLVIEGFCPAQKVPLISSPKWADLLHNQLV